MKKLLIGWTIFILVLLGFGIYLRDSEAQILDTGDLNVDYYQVTEGVDLATDNYYQDLDLKYPGKVTKYIDSYGIGFYAVDISNGGI